MSLPWLLSTTLAMASPGGACAVERPEGLRAPIADQVQEERALACELRRLARGIIPIEAPQFAPSVAIRLPPRRPDAVTILPLPCASAACDPRVELTALLLPAAASELGSSAMSPGSTARAQVQAWLGAPEPRAVLAAADALLFVGAASQEGGLEQETDRACRRAEALRAVSATLLSPPPPDALLVLGRHRCAPETSPWCERVEGELPDEALSLTAAQRPSTVVAIRGGAASEDRVADLWARWSALPDAVRPFDPTDYPWAEGAPRSACAP